MAGYYEKIGEREYRLVVETKRKGKLIQHTKTVNCSYAQVDRELAKFFVESRKIKPNNEDDTPK